MWRPKISGVLLPPSPAPRPRFPSTRDGTGHTTSTAGYLTPSMSHATALKSPVKSPIAPRCPTTDTQQRIRPAHCTVTKSWRPLRRPAVSRQPGTLPTAICGSNSPRAPPPICSAASAPRSAHGPHHLVLRLAIARAPTNPGPVTDALRPLSPLWQSYLPIECVSRHQPIVSRPSKFWTWFSLCLMKSGSSFVLRACVWTYVGRKCLLQSSFLCCRALATRKG